MQNTTKKSAIQNIALTLVNGSKPANPKKPSKAVIMLSQEDTLQAIGQYKEGYKKGLDSISLMNDALKPFHDAKVKLCKASEKSSPLLDYTTMVRQMFLDTFKGLINPRTNKPLSKDYIEKMLYPAFFNAVNSGKEIEQINASQAKAKDNKASQKSKGGQDDNAKMINTLKNVWVLSDVAQDAIEYLESKIESGSGFIEAIEDLLKKEGIELGDAE